jgi:hypothetical protein
LYNIPLQGETEDTRKIYKMDARSLLLDDGTLQPEAARAGAHALAQLRDAVTLLRQTVALPARSGPEGEEQALRAGREMTLGNPTYLLSRLLVELAVLLEAISSGKPQGSSEGEGEQQSTEFSRRQRALRSEALGCYREAAAVFPGAVEAPARAGKSVLIEAESWDDLAAAKGILESALRMSETLAEEKKRALQLRMARLYNGDGHNQSSSDDEDSDEDSDDEGRLDDRRAATRMPEFKHDPDCLKRELGFGPVARERLAMLACQEGREPDASHHLSALGFRYRLSPEVLNYRDPTNRLNLADKTSPDKPEISPDAAREMVARSMEYARALDGVLPVEALKRMQDVFRPGSAFWVEHGYHEFESNGYFSYLFDLVSRRHFLLKPIRCFRINWLIITFLFFFFFGTRPALGKSAAQLHRTSHSPAAPVRCVAMAGARRTRSRCRMVGPLPAALLGPPTPL